MISEEVVRCLKNQASSNYDKENGYIEVTTPIINSADVDNTVISQPDNDDMGTTGTTLA